MDNSSSIISKPRTPPGAPLYIVRIGLLSVSSLVFFQFLRVEFVLDHLAQGFRVVSLPVFFRIVFFQLFSLDVMRELRFNVASSHLTWDLLASLNREQFWFWSFASAKGVYVITHGRGVDFTFFGDETESGLFIP